MNWKVILAAVLIGAAGSYGLTHWRDNVKIVALQQHADSVSFIAWRSDSAAVASNVVATLALKKLDVVEKAAEVDAASADTRVAAFHGTLHQLIAANAEANAAFDSLEQAHADQTAQLQKAKDAADAKVLILGAENFTLLQTVHALNGQVQDLNKRIQALNHKTLPKWLDVSLTVVKTGLMVKGGYDVVKGR